MHQKTCFQVLDSGTRLYVETEHTELDGVCGISIEVFTMTGRRKRGLEKSFYRHSQLRKMGGLKAVRDDLFNVYGKMKKAA